MSGKPGMAVSWIPKRKFFSSKDIPPISFPVIVYLCELTLCSLEGEMKRVFFIIVAIAIMASPLAALDFSIGPKVAVGDSSYRGADWKLFADAFGIKNKISVSFAGGLSTVIDFSPMIGLEVDAMYKSATFRYGDSSYWVSDGYSAITFPVYTRFSFDAGNLGIYALAGVDLSLLIGDYKFKDSDGVTGTSTLEAAGIDNKFLYGLALGAGVVVPLGSGSMDVGMKYSTNLNQLADGTDQFMTALDIEAAYRFTF